MPRLLCERGGVEGATRPLVVVVAAASPLRVEWCVECDWVDRLERADNGVWGV